MTGTSGIEISLSLLAGMLLGSGYFALLYRCVRLAAADAPVWWLTFLHVLRLGAAIAAFWVLAQLGAWPLLAGLLGFLIARVFVQRLVSAR